jgi:hypothetical protein
MARLKSVCPVSDEDTSALPVKELGPAVAFCEAVLGFSVVGRDASTALLTRDDVQIGLVVNEDFRPERAGSIAFEVDDLEAMHRELVARGGSPGVFGLDEWNGKQHHTFFLREEGGYCYCFYRPVDTDRD